MNTEHLITMLARQSGPAPTALAARRLWPAGLLGVGVSAALALAIFGPIPAWMWSTPAPWLKMAYALALALSAGWCVARLGRPGAATGGVTAFLLLVLAVAASWALVDWWSTPNAERWPDWVGHSAMVCPLLIAGLAMPALGAMLWALKGLAPTCPGLTGAAAGLSAGAAAALGYGAACTEVATTFVVTWYTLGIALSGALGTLIGPRVLRW